MKILSKEVAPAREYPEKVLQFGTGVLLRGLPDYFIEKANRQGIFEGGIVVVKSTANGGTGHFREQDNRYTIHIKGLESGREVTETMVVSAINRVVPAADNWDVVIKCASNPDLKIVISNATEVGIVLDEQDKLFASPPRSFPGKLAAFLYRRYEAFDGAPEKGMIILPTELIDNNGQQLKDIVCRLARLHGLPEAFLAWLEKANFFCNTLVDRIVPGRLSHEEQLRAEAVLGYHDSLAIMAEPFRLWAIETADRPVLEALSFAKADSGVVLTRDITKFKELKLRLLNGTHTFSCALAMLAGWRTVKQAMEDDAFSGFIRDLMVLEIIPSLSTTGVSETEAHAFANSVIDRFSNPFLEHTWSSISFNYTSKMQLRNVATIQRYTQLQVGPPIRMALGFAAYLLLIRDAELDDLLESEVKDAWKHKDLDTVVDAALEQTSIWKVDLRKQTEWSSAVKKQLRMLIEGSVQESINILLKANV